MEKILLISRVAALEKRLGELLDSPRHVARISSWQEAHRVITRATPATVIVGSEMIGASQISEIVRLDNVLQKEDRKAYFFMEEGDVETPKLAQMFDSVSSAIVTPGTPRQWSDLRPLLRAHLPAPDDSSSPGKAAEPSKKTELVIRLPKIASGKLESLSLTRILYSLSVQRATGLLGLRSGKVSRRFAFNSGRLIDSPNTDLSTALISAFAWPHGEFKFKEHQAISGKPLSIYPVVIEGLATHRPQRQIMDSLMPMMATFPVVTQLWEERRTTLAWPLLGKFLRACDGQSTLEAVLSTMGIDVTEAFRAALFAGDTDLLVFRGEKTADSIHIQYDQNAGASTSRAETSSPNTPSKAERASGSERLTLEKEMRAFYAGMQKMSAHDVFGVWPGCGREVVKETFYSLVKEHHPDVYGGNVSGQVKSLSQQIYVGIRKAYAELMAIEKEQTKAPPDPSAAPKRQPGRRHVTTLHPGQFNQADLGDDDSAAKVASRAQTPNRQEHPSAPIGMGRVPTGPHPDLQRRQQQAATSPDAKSDRSPTPPPSMGSRRPRRTTSSAGGSVTPPKTSAVGLDEGASDPEWRREKLQQLGRNTSRSRRPTPMARTKSSVGGNADPARDHFNAGYQFYKVQKFDDAHQAFQKAFAAEGDNGLYMTFYAHTLYLVDAKKSEKAKELLRKAIDTKHRQALPDAHLFLGQILKTDGKEKRAYVHFSRALELNPASRDAEREVRLYERRHGKDEKKEKSGEGGSFFKNLFKK